MIKKKYELVRDKVRRQAHLVFKKIKRQSSREITNQDIQLMLAEYSSTFCQVLRDEEIEKLHNLIAKLSEQQMQIIRMKFWEGMTEREIAINLGQSDSWVHRRIHEAYKVMRA